MKCGVTAQAIQVDAKRLQQVLGIVAKRSLRGGQVTVKGLTADVDIALQTSESGTPVRRTTRTY